MNFVDASALGREDAKTFGIRPEHITVSEAKADLAGKVSHIEHLGADTNLFVDCDDAGLIAARLPGEQNFDIDAVVNLQFADGRIYRFDDNGRSIV